MQPDRSRRAIGMCGRAGRGDRIRVDAMSDLLGGVRSLVNEPAGALRGDASSVVWAAPGVSGVSWSPTPLPATLSGDAGENATRHDAFSFVVGSDTAQLHSGISGAAPIYVDLARDPCTAPGQVHFCSRIAPLVRTRPGPLAPDWDAWAHILAAGGPLDGRTTFAGIRRLGPWSSVVVEPAREPVVTSAGWPWLEAADSAGASVDAVREALVAAVTALAGRTGLTSLLSGGWDSRILSVLATQAGAERRTAWTTSSDTGTVMEELVAATVAEQLGAHHQVIPPRWDEFDADLRYFAQAADYQTSFHVWLVPLAKSLAGTAETVLDGLGGGLFVGGAFPDEDSDRPVLERRFDRLARYLHGGEEILHPRAVEQIRDRARAGFDDVAKPLLGHPFASTFTAYLTRTLPGISLAPYGLMARSAPVATPFLDDAVVRAALAIPAEEHADGRLYSQVLRPLHAELAELPTALDLTPAQRHHQRRVSSPQAARVFRDLLTREPVRELLAPELAGADLEVWRRYLNLTRPQHLIRGLATLSLWLEHYADVLDRPGVETLLGRG